MLPADQAFLVIFEMCGQFCPNQIAWEVSEITQFSSCKAQQLGTEEKLREVLCAQTALGYSGPPWQGTGESFTPCCLASSISALQLTRVPGGSTECTAISTFPATSSAWSMWRVGNPQDSSAKLFPAHRKSFFFLDIFNNFAGQNVWGFEPETECPELEIPISVLLTWWGHSNSWTW